MRTILLVLLLPPFLAGCNPLRIFSVHTMEIQQGNVLLSMLMNENESVVQCPVAAPVPEDLEGFRVAFNPDYLEDFLRVVGDGPLDVAFKDAASQVLFEPGRAMRYVVMPMSLPESVPAAQPAVAGQ